MKTLKAFIKPFQAPQRIVKMKILNINFNNLLQYTKPEGLKCTHDIIIIKSRGSGNKL